MNVTAETWETWTPRPEIAPRFSRNTPVGDSEGGALQIEAGANPAAIGAWRQRVDGILGGRCYRFSARYRAQGVAHPARSVSARLVWLDENGALARPPDTVPDGQRSGVWTTVEHVTFAPENARSVRLEVWLGWAAHGTVWWDDIAFAEEPAPHPRVVRALTVFHRPQDTHSPAESVAQFVRLVEDAPIDPDLVCLPEAVTLIGTGCTYAEVSEPVPGPATDALGLVARQRRCYLSAGLIERAGNTLYNTAVLLGRSGEIVGAYRKTHLPREEVEGGLTPGDSYPVFDTDFGRVGLLICWDAQFPEPARALALRGAEILLLPIWGGSETLVRARAIENHVFLISSSYDMKTFIVDPAGEVLAEATSDSPLAWADLHLDRPLIQPWLGDMRARTWKERRPDILMEKIG